MEENAHDPKQFWKMVKKLYPTGNKSVSHSTAFDISGELTTDKNTIANSFCRHFTTCAEKLCRNLPSIFNWWNEGDINLPSTHFKCHLITKHNVLRHLLNLKSTKAPGHDNLPPKMLKDAAQFGFRRRYNTKLAVTLFTDRIRLAMDQGKLTGAVFIDLQKALDTVEHSVLLSKLPFYGVTENELMWIENNLSGRFHENEKINVNVSCKIGVQCTYIAKDSILFNTSPKYIGDNDAKDLDVITNFHWGFVPLTLLFYSGGGSSSGNNELEVAPHQEHHDHHILPYHQIASSALASRPMPIYTVRRNYQPFRAQLTTSRKSKHRISSSSAPKNFGNIQGPFTRDIILLSGPDDDLVPRQNNKQPIIDLAEEYNALLDDSFFDEDSDIMDETLIVTEEDKTVDEETINEILFRLGSNISNARISKFNLSRSHIWESATWCPST
eukprot:gene4064-4618_t